MTKPIIVDEEKLLDLIYKATNSYREVNSNLWSDVKKNIEAHTISIAEIKNSVESIAETVDKISGKFDMIKEKVDETEGQKKGAAYIVSLSLLIILGLVGVVYTFTNNRIDKIETHVYAATK